MYCAAFDTWQQRVCRLAGWVQPSAARRAELEGRLLLARTDMTNGLRTSRRPIIPSATLCCTLLQPGATCTTAPPGLQIASTITICCHPLLHTVVTCTMASAPPGAPPDLHIAPAARISSVQTCALWHKRSTIAKVQQAGQQQCLSTKYYIMGRQQQSGVSAVDIVVRGNFQATTRSNV